MAVAMVALRLKRSCPRTIPQQEPDLAVNGSTERSGRVYRGLFLETAIANADALQAFEQEFDAMPLES